MIFEMIQGVKIQLISSIFRLRILDVPGMICDQSVKICVICGELLNIYEHFCNFADQITLL